MHKQTRPLRPMWLLGGIGLIIAVLLAGIHELTRERIAQETELQALALLHQVMPADHYDNDLLSDRLTVALPGLLADATMYRARLGDRPSGAVFDVTTPNGYSGPIRLLVSVDFSGRVLGVRVLQHRETPGLGDTIEITRSRWILGFDGRSLGNPVAQAWQTSRRGGDFDTLTSATITSQAVVVAVRDVLEFYALQRDTLY